MSRDKTELSKRERFAMAAMQGILACNPPKVEGTVLISPKYIASEAVILADALLKELGES